MKKNIFYPAIFLFTISLSSYLMATNELSVLTDAVGSTKPGFMDKVILVIEPHGGYFEQSLYIEYSDHNQFPGNNNVEIVHRFELPEGSVINDMWLWIGDSVMQAVMMDTWTATEIYDSIVVNKRDPALLKKKGNQYELHVYPLKSGSYRKVKINMITPVKWIGDNATVELPFRMLNSNNNIIKRIEILFRKKSDSWGTPSIVEFPEKKFAHLVDTLGYDYSNLLIDNIGGKSSLKITYSTTFNGGKYITGYVDKSNKAYFQLGILPEKFFNLKKDLAPKKNFYAIDLSGNKNNNINYLLPNLSKVINSSMKDGDKFNIIVSGANEIKNISNGWQNYSQTLVNNILNGFKATQFADSIQKRQKANILFCDIDAKNSWYFEEIENYADVKYYRSIMNARSDFNKVNIIAAYRHGYDDIINLDDLDKLLTPLDSFFVKGGRLVTYFDQNRNNGELLAKYYINGLKAGIYKASAQTLYRNERGNIGMNFPEQIDHNFVYELEYDDPDVMVELKTANGAPVIISKKIRNGLIVVTGFWQIKDDGAVKSILSPAILGLNKVSKNLLLPNVLSFISDEHKNVKFDNCTLFSNSDSIYSKIPTENFITDYLSQFDTVPKFNTINLLDGLSVAPPSIIIDNNLYYGSGYLLNELSSKTGGLHLETYKNDWDYIASMSNYALNPSIKKLKIDVVIDDGNGDLKELREVNPVKNDPNKPRFFIAETDGKNKANFNISATFNGIDKPIERNFEFLFSHDSTKYETLIPSLLANETLKDMFNSENIDTLGIVNLAIKHNLLKDFTALIALEPNDSLHFLKNPNDESGFTDIETETNPNSDSLSVEIYPNPFNSQVQVKLILNETSRISVSIYNILGQKVIDIARDKNADNSYSFIWNGKSSFGVSVATGLYILKVDVTGIGTNKREIITKKLLYLK